MARSIHLKLSRDEVVLALLLQGGLFLHQSPECGHVLEACAGRHEELTVVTPVAQAWLEDILQEAPVLLRQLRHAGPEGTPQEVLAGPIGCRLLCCRLRRHGQVKVVQGKVHALRNPGSANSKLGHGTTSRDHAGRKRWHTRSCHLCRRSTASDAAWCHGQVEASIDCVHLRGQAALRSHDLAVGDMDLGSTVLVPELRDLLGGEWLLRSLKGHPRVVKASLVLHHELGKACRLGELPQVVNGALPLRNEVKVVGEGLGVLDQRVVMPGDWHVFVAIGALADLTGLNAELHTRDHNVVLRHLDLGLLDHKPLSANPLLLKALLL
mmetsp:Transcript_64593/g.172300  ORF Transcript_64593/g.172300 Transcript_64593/m.172300 type:complete len:324 (+) Transcript_64593:1007-1978(+)